VARTRERSPPALIPYHLAKHQTTSEHVFTGRERLCQPCFPSKFALAFETEAKLFIFLVYVTQLESIGHAIYAVLEPQLLAGIWA
jgi:hypothetical protein